MRDCETEENRYYLLGLAAIVDVGKLHIRSFVVLWNRPDQLDNLPRLAGHVYSCRRHAPVLATVITGFLALRRIESLSKVLQDLSTAAVCCVDAIMQDLLQDLALTLLLFP